MRHAVCDLGEIPRRFISSQQIYIQKTINYTLLIKMRSQTLENILYLMTYFIVMFLLFNGFRTVKIGN